MTIARPVRRPGVHERAGESWSATVSWWWFVIIAGAGLASGVLLARVERVRIRKDDDERV